MISGRVIAASPNRRRAYPACEVSENTMTNENKRNRHICTGLMAHVDSGKTTLSEALLYASGSNSETWKSRYKRCVSGYGREGT